MADIKILDPVTRIEGHMKIEVKVETVGGVQEVIDAKATGTLFRGFETILTNRDPKDATPITQRICGVCPVSHGMASVTALDQAGGVSVPNNARVIRNLVLGANYIQSHILHFYHLAALDFIDGPNMAPWTPRWSADKRFDSATTNQLIGHYVQALDMRRTAHEMAALFGGRMPHPPTFIPGGVSVTPRDDRKKRFLDYLNKLIPFINDVYIPDVEALGNTYPEYFVIGAGWKNLLSYGVFDLDSAGKAKLLSRGRVLNASKNVQSVDVGRIAEQVTYSWYSDSTNGLPPAKGSTKPVDPASKKNAYSWLKTPRYDSQPYEVGPLARMWASGNYQKGISVMDRHLARAKEAQVVANALTAWVNELYGTTVCTPWTAPSRTTSAFGLTEAPRGALGHWVSIANGKIANYQVITPTCWNASPKDTAGNSGPIEKALIGTPVKNINEPVEVVRVIHSFDPCLACAVHVMRPSAPPTIIKLGGAMADGSVNSPSIAG